MVLENLPMELPIRRFLKESRMAVSKWATLLSLALHRPSLETAESAGRSGGKGLRNRVDFVVEQRRTVEALSKEAKGSAGSIIRGA